MATPDPAPFERRWRVLIVDQDRAHAESVAAVLAAEGHDSVVVTSAAAALSEARSKGYDLALLGVRLPAADGADTLAQLREAAPSSDVIVMSDDATLESALDTVRGGAFAYLLNPLDRKDLVRLCGMALRHVALRRERDALLLQLRRSESLYRTVVEAAPTMIVGLDPVGRITLVNAALEVGAGVPRDALLGRPFGELFPEAFRARASWTSDWPREIPLLAPDGHERWVTWSRGRGEQVSYAFGVDVTELRALEHRLRLADELAVLGEFAAGLAHALRNPLNSALLELTVLSRKLARDANADALGSVETVRAELDRLQRLLAAFMSPSRPRTFAVRALELSSSAADVARLVSPEAAERGVTIALEFDADAAPVAVDEERIQQAILHLVRNAMDAVLRGGRIVLRVRSTDRRFTTLQVEDDGPGIEGDPAELFQPFRTTKASGTGLGLTIAQRIAVEHGGELAVESAPGRTVFTLTLPATRGPTDAPTR